MTPSIISLLQNGIELGEEFCNDPEGNEWHALGLGVISIFDREPRTPGYYKQRAPNMHRMVNNARKLV